MNQTLRDAFARQLDDAGRVDVDIEALIDRGETRLRRRRLAVVVGAAAAVVLVLAAIAGVTGSHLVGRGDRPVDHPPTPVPTPAPTRPIVYSDYDAHGPDNHLGTIHVGDRAVEISSGFIHMDVTDDGVVYTTGGYLDDGRVWFTDGSRPEQIGSHACAAPHGYGNTVVTADSGSLAAWVDCTPGQDLALVVYDTGTGRQIVREPVTRCRARYAMCYVDAIIADHVYLTRYVGTPLEFDMTTGRLTEDRSYAQDIRDNPRGLVIGDSWQTGRPTDAIGQPFWVSGSRLVPVDKLEARNPVPAEAFDTLTQRPVRLHLPPGYKADHDELGRGDFWLFEYLDDDTVALVGWDEAPGYGDILTCRLSNGRCELAVPGHGPGRVTANSGLPG